MQRQTSLGRGHVVLDQPRLVGRQTVNHQTHRAHAMAHQLTQQMHEQFGGQTALIGAVPEPALGVDGRSSADRLTLTRAIAG